MNRTPIIWLVAAFCAIIVFTALGIISYDLVQRDRAQTFKAYEAEKLGRIRLAMWRLDTLATSIIQQEDERSVFEFTNPEFTPEQLPKMENGLNQTTQLNVNNLYFSSPKNTNLYWNFHPTENAKVISPQVYNDSYLIQNEVDVAGNSFNRKKLNSLKKILSSKAEYASDHSQTYDNKALSCVAAHVSLDQWGAIQARQNTTSNDFSYKQQQLDKTTIHTKNLREEQLKLSSADKNIREKALSRIAPSKQNAWKGRYRPTAKKTEQSFKLEKIDISEFTNKPTLETKKPSTPAPALTLQEPFSTPFTPIWLNSELMLVRKVNGSNGDSVQGVWINSEKLIEQLLAEIEDLFPDANLTRVEQDIDHLLNPSQVNNDYLSMVKLPLRLNPNEIKHVIKDPLAYFKGPIGLAWLGSFLAVLASFFMLKSVLNMSERRASFVSSVTHELRTPLTTFRLYSDLLSTGMVKDPDKQQSYLGTLKHEADRLTHLVDNVLSYSRIEKGSAKAKVEDISIANLMDRMHTRLVERSAEELMLVDIIYSQDVGEQHILTDITATEQIIFNLVDNACKYASGEDYGERIEINIEQDGKFILFQVCDEGPGINAREQNKLFRPFHKSAKDAADTKPGVGLGLALCRRLARAMKGDITIVQKADVKGACFQLSLPLK